MKILNTRPISAFFLGFSLVSGIHAAQVNLKDLMLQAERQDIFSREYAALQQMAQARLSEVKVGKFVPHFDLQVIGGVVPDATVNPDNVNEYTSRDLNSNEGFSWSKLGPFVQAEVKVVQPLFTFGKISSLEKMASFGKELAEAETQKKKVEIRSLVKKAYYTLLFASESLDILRDVEKRLTDAAEKVEELLVKNAENVTEVDRLKIKVFLADVRNRILDAERGQRLARSALQDLANLKGDWTLDTAGLVAEKVSDLTRESVVKAALEAKPELIQVSRLADIKRAEYEAARAELLPTFFVGGEVSYAKAPGRTDVDNPYLSDSFNNFSFGVVLGLKQNLGIFRTMKRMEGLEAEAERMNALRDQLKMKSKLEAERAFEEAFSAMSAIGVNEDGFRAARSWLTSTGLEFNLGTAETKEVLESFAAYFKARVDMLRSAFNLNMALTDLSQISGTEMVDRLKVKEAL